MWNHILAIDRLTTNIDYDNNNDDEVNQWLSNAMSITHSSRDSRLFSRTRNWTTCYGGFKYEEMTATRVRGLVFSTVTKQSHPVHLRIHHLYPKAGIIKLCVWLPLLLIFLVHRPLIHHYITARGGMYVQEVDRFHLKSIPVHFNVFSRHWLGIRSSLGATLILAKRLLLEGHWLGWIIQGGMYH